MGIMQFYSVSIQAWGIFLGFVIGMLMLDIGIFHRKSHTLSMKEAVWWTIVWITIALLINAVIFYWKGPKEALEYFTAYIIEKSLSIDNIFVFVTIFSYFQVSSMYQHRVLFYGILGALIMRGLFIIGGIALINQFHWIIYIFGAILLITGFKLLFKSESVDIEKNPVLKLCRKILPITKDYHGQKFIIRKMGKTFVTPMMVVLIVIEATDVIFAFDSVPAVFGVTRNPFIAFTSNIMAILGLRALYFVLANLVSKFCYLNIGLAIILIFIGMKMLIEDFYDIPITVSLGFICLCIATSIFFSMRKN